MFDIFFISVNLIYSVQKYCSSVESFVFYFVAMFCHSYDLFSSNPLLQEVQQTQVYWVRTDQNVNCKNHPNNFSICLCCCVLVAC
jgi:hypothetical protein